jgi:hypothetical protein
MSSLGRRRSYVVALLDSFVSLVQSPHPMHVERGILVYSDSHHLLPQVDLGITIPTPHPSFDRGKQHYVPAS